MTDPLLLFVCTGNICRSPMAEYLLRDALPPASPWRVASAGTFAADGMPASREGVTALAELGISMNSHLSQSVTRDLADAAQLIIVMAHSHRDLLLSAFPEVSEKTFLIKEFDPDAREDDVADPIGSPLSVYRHTRNEIRDAITGLLDFMARLDA